MDYNAAMVNDSGPRDSSRMNKAYGTTVLCSTVRRNYYYVGHYTFNVGRLICHSFLTHLPTVSYCKLQY